MIAFKNFNLSRLLSLQVAAGLLGGETKVSNDFLDFFGRGNGEALTYES